MHPNIHQCLLTTRSSRHGEFSFSSLCITLCLSLSLQLKNLLESYSEAHDDFAEALQISPTNLRAKYQKLINDAKIGAKENRPERVEQALSSFEEYYDTCKQDIYYALALTSVSPAVTKDEHRLRFL